MFADKRHPSSKSGAALLCGLAGSCFIFSPHASAEDFLTTVDAGQTTTTTHVLDAPAASDTHTFNNAGTARGATAAAAVLTGSGQGRVVINNDGRLQNRIDFSALSGGVIFNNNTGGVTGGWQYSANLTTAPNNFSAGDDILNNAAGATITGNGLLNFGAGRDTLNNHGVVALTGSVAGGGGTLSGLEVLNNSGTINIRSAVDLESLTNSGTLSVTGNMNLSKLELFRNTGTLHVFVGPSGEGFVYNGSQIETAALQSFDNDGLIVMSSEGNTALGNRLLMPGVNFVAGPNSHLILDAILDGGWQDNCRSMGLYGAYQADCINLTGGSTSGMTLLTINGVPVEDGGAYGAKGVALIDVGGGTSSAEHFVLDPASPNFDLEAFFGGGIRASELFTYHLFYDAATQVHRLVGIPDGSFMTLGVLPAAAQSLWRTGEQAAAARQGELRFAKTDATGGFWFKAAGSESDRDAQSRFAVFGRTDRVQTNYKQRDHAYTLGADVVGVDGNSGYSLGLSIGDLNSTVKFDASPTRAELSGMGVNLYGSYHKGRFFLDLSGGGYAGDLEGTLAVGSSMVEMDSSISAFGVRTEAGYRLPLAGWLSLDPLASVIYVRSGIGDIAHLPGSNLNALQFDSGASLRGGLGARAVIESTVASLKLGLSLSGHVWREFDGKSTSHVRTRVDAFPFSSTFDGTFSEVEAELDLASAGGAVSGYLSFGGQFGDDYRSTTASLGLRYNW